MMYQVKITIPAQLHINAYLKAGNKILIKKIDKILNELRVHPYTGIGKPERLKYFNGNIWSRRVDSKNRIVYSIEESVITVTVISAAGHYGDK